MVILYSWLLFGCSLVALWLLCGIGAEGVLVGCKPTFSFRRITTSGPTAGRNPPEHYQRGFSLSSIDLVLR